MKKNKAIIFGNSNFAQMLQTYLLEQQIQTEAFCVEKQYCISNEFSGRPLVGIDSVSELYPSTDYDAYIAVGYTQMGNIRSKVYQLLEEKGYRLPNYVHPTVVMGPNFVMGKGNIILQSVNFGYETIIGNGNLIFDGTVIAHNVEIGSFNTISINVSACGFSKIKNHCFVGAGACIRDHIQVLDYTLIGANTYIRKDTSPYQVYSSAEAKQLEKNSLQIF